MPADASPASSERRGKRQKSTEKGVLQDGFRTVPEPTPLEVHPDNLSAFTLPAEALTFTPLPNTVFCHFANKDRERKIYCNLELTALEQEQLRKLREEATAQKLVFSPSIAVMAMRFLSRARGDAAKAIKLMKATHEWRQRYFEEGPIRDKDVMEDMKHGIVYFCGRDSALRPTIIVRANRIPSQWYKDKRIDKLIRILVFSMEYMIRYMLVPGSVENNSLIVDLSGLGVTQVPLGALKEIYEVMSHHYIGRVYKFYICNLSSGLSYIVRLAMNLLTDRQKQKLVFLEDFKVLQKEYALHQLETDFGGTRPVLDTFFPFPLSAGPFEGGYTKGPHKDAVPGGHGVLTAEGARGRLWNPQRSREENELLEYTPEAVDFFKECGLPLPPGCVRQLRQAQAAEAAETPTDVAKTGEAAAAGVTGEVGEMGEELEENSSEASEDAMMQHEAVEPRGAWSCMPCCSKN